MKHENGKRWGLTRRWIRGLLKAGLLFAVLFAPRVFCHAQQQQEQTVTFEIRLFEIKGNTLFDEFDIEQVLRPFAGPEKTAEDVEKARDALEKLYHEKGYPAVFVNIPEQTVEEGTVRLQVIESRIGRVKVSGNRYFSRTKIRKKLASLQPGEILYVPAVQEDLAIINRNPDLKVAPVLAPGRELGLIDVELKVADRLPLHGSLELNNRSTHDTTDLRANALIRYDNLWQKEHSVSVQYQTSPQDMDEVQVIAGSYVLPAPWNEDFLVALYGVWSDSETAFGEGFRVTGKGNIFGARLVMPLPGKDAYNHNVTAGLDYKNFDETLGFLSEAEGGVKTPMRYLPLLFSYNGTLQDSWGQTRFSGGLNMVFRGLVTDQRQFEVKRYQAKGNYLFATLGVERMQKLPFGFGLFAKLDGQIADQPLISNEQFTAGGMESVRGYKESEVLGDDAIHGTIELLGPDLGDLVGLTGKVQFLPFLFYDFATLRTQEPLPEQDEWQTIQGVGVGVRGKISKYVEYEVSAARALEDTDKVVSGDYEVYFKVKAAF
ncbi:MAG: ShlB/FhaC/HecB family hemolysin secretion/activation protein [Deltaproteobacteria bacterium]|nr:ShlB/FhaC/HecB family hemolysin secretion/activation protein [Deltaproteobacteria bacterium]